MEVEQPSRPVRGDGEEDRASGLALNLALPLEKLQQQRESEAAANQFMPAIPFKQGPKEAMDDMYVPQESDGWLSPSGIVERSYSVGDRSEMGSDPASRSSSLQRTWSPLSRTPRLDAFGYQVGRVLGEGGFGVVREAHDAITGKKVVIKFAGSGKKNPGEALKLEADIMSKFQHENVIGFVDVVNKDDAGSFIVMEHAGGGDLFDFIIQEKGKGKEALDEEEACRIIVQVVLALEHIHSQNYLHGDVKPENVFLTDTGDVRLGDLGLATEYSPTSSPRQVPLGTVDYASPESLLGAKLFGFMHPVVDVWSLGVMLFVMVRGFHPFAGDTETDVMRAILKKEPDYGDKLSPELHDLLSQMLEKKPTLRISIDEVRKHPWIRDELARQEMAKRKADLRKMEQDVNLVTPRIEVATSRERQPIDELLEKSTKPVRRKRRKKIEKKPKPGAVAALSGKGKPPLPADYKNDDKKDKIMPFRRLGGAIRKSKDSIFGVRSPRSMSRDRERRIFRGDDDSGVTSSKEKEIADTVAQWYGAGNTPREKKRPNRLLSPRSKNRMEFMESKFEEWGYEKKKLDELTDDQRKELIEKKIEEWYEGGSLSEREPSQLKESVLDWFGSLAHSQRAPTSPKAPSSVAVSKPLNSTKRSHADILKELGIESEKSEPEVIEEIQRRAIIEDKVLQWMGGTQEEMMSPRPDEEIQKRVLSTERRRTDAGLSAPIDVKRNKEEGRYREKKRGNTLSDVRISPRNEMANSDTDVILRKKYGKGLESPGRRRDKTKKKYRFSVDEYKKTRFVFDSDSDSEKKKRRQSMVVSSAQHTVTLSSVNRSSSMEEKEGRDIRQTLAGALSNNSAEIEQDIENRSQDAVIDVRKMLEDRGHRESFELYLESERNTNHIVLWDSLQLIHRLTKNPKGHSKWKLQQNLTQKMLQQHFRPACPREIVAFEKELAEYGEEIVPFCVYDGICQHVEGLLKKELKAFRESDFYDESL